MPNDRRDISGDVRDADDTKDGFWSMSGVYAIAAAIGLLCCGLPVLLAAGAGGIFGFLSSGTVISVLVVAAMAAGIAVLIRPDRRRWAEFWKGVRKSHDKYE